MNLILIIALLAFTVFAFNVIFTGHGKKKSKTDSFTQDMINSAHKMIDESTEIIQNTKNIDIMISRYKVARDIITKERSNQPWTIENVDEAMDQLIEISTESLDLYLHSHINEKIASANALKTEKGRQTRLGKERDILVKARQDTPVELVTDNLNKGFISVINRIESIMPIPPNRIDSKPKIE